MYFDNIRPYFIHVYAFETSLLSLLTLTLYPLIMVLVGVIKRFGPNKLMIPIMQVAVFVYPLVWIKIMIELVSSLAKRQYLYLTLPLGLVNLGFGGIILILQGKSFRLLEFLIVIMLELKANIYAIIIMMIIRLVILTYLLRWSNRNSLALYYEFSLIAVLMTAPFCDDQILNNFGFLIVVLACIALGVHQTRLALQK